MGQAVTVAADEREDTDRVDLFVSYAGPDRPWAEWVAWHLDAAGLTVELDVWDWAAGDNTALRMSDALARADRVLAVYSPAYFERSRFTTVEWTAVVGERPDDHGRQRLVPIRIRYVDPPPVLRAVRYCDLVGLNEVQARRELVAAVRGPQRPGRAPDFPGGPLVPVSAGPRLPGSLPSVWNVRRRNPVFTGREPQLAALRHRLCAGNRALVQALHGMGGVGKTLLAVEYAHLFAHEYDLVWWIDAERTELVAEQLTELAVTAGWVGSDTTTGDALRAVRQRLLVAPRWLLILDNAPTVVDVAELIPAGNGHIVITSRSGHGAGIAVPIEVTVFSRSESVALLAEHLPTLAAGDANQLATAVGDLPLALAQAAGLLAETGMPVGEYLSELTDHAADLLTASRAGGYPVPLATVIQTSMGQLDTVDPAAAQLLHLAAMLAPEPIPLSWFTGAPAELLGPDLGPVAARPVAFRRSVARLTAYGLARAHQDTIQLHRLTQAVIRDITGTDPQRAQEFLVAVAPDDGRDLAQWSQWAQLLPHLLALNPVTSDVLRSVTHQALDYLHGRGDHRAMLPLARAWHDHWTVRVGPDDRQSYVTSTFLAVALRALGESEQARHLDEDTLTHRGRILGDDHPDTLLSANNLADDLRALGQHERARQLDEDTLARRRRILGDDHPDTLTSANSLAADLFELGQHERARQLDEDTLTRRRRILGDDHPDTLTSASNLADDLRALGQHERARQLDEDTLARRRRILGDDHPDTLLSANNLADDLHALGQHEQAHKLDRDVASDH
jgi:hypothetical protein